MLLKWMIHSGSLKTFDWAIWTEIPYGALEIVMTEYLWRSLKKWSPLANVTWHSDAWQDIVTSCTYQVFPDSWHWHKSSHLPSREVLHVHGAFATEESCQQGWTYSSAHLVPSHFGPVYALPFMSRFSDCTLRPRRYFVHCIMMISIW